MQACRDREEARKAANSLVEDLDSFLDLENHVDEIKERERSRKAVLEMLSLIAEILNYICNFIPSGISGVYCSS